MLLQTGTLLKGRFKVEKRLNGGGMGEVYLGRDRDTGKSCVLKVPLIDSKGGNNDVKRDKLEIEADFLSSVNHPNIVSYLDHFQYNAEPCLAMEYLKGDTLLEETNGPIKESSAKKILYEIMDAVEYVHNQGAIHRDLKPGNIILDGSGVTLIDFGTVKRTGNYTTPRLEPGTIIRSGHWTAPEQGKRGYAGPQSDIFALGTTVYYMLAGQEPPIPPLNLEGLTGIQVSKRMADVVDNATRPKPQSRFSSVAEMRKALEGEAKQVPRLVVAGRTEIPLETTKPQIVGRKGSSKLGPDDIGIKDPDPQSDYISRRHAKLHFNRGDELIIEDLDSLNGTWLLVKGDWKKIEPGNPWKLPSGSMIAFAYNEDKGPYVTATVKGV